MTPKTVLFVRHGESLGNSEGRFGHPDEPLTDKGREQAAQAAARLEKIPFDALFASTDLRAEQTAEIIGARVGKTFVVDERFREFRSPSVMRGKHFDDPEAQRIQTQVKDHWDNLEWRHSDEDTFLDRRVSAAAALAYLAERPESKLVVVSHYHFIKTIAASVLLGADMDQAPYRSVMNGMYHDNTGITDVRLNEKGTWRVYHWNDIAHFG